MQVWLVEIDEGVDGSTICGLYVSKERALREGFRCAYERHHDHHGVSNLVPEQDADPECYSLMQLRSLCGDVRIYSMVVEGPKVEEAIHGGEWLGELLWAIREIGGRSTPGPQRLEMFCRAWWDKFPVHVRAAVSAKAIGDGEGILSNG